MKTITVTTTVHREGSTCYLPLPFDPKAVFGKVRAPVRVLVNGYSFRSTIAAMGGPPCVPFRRSHREAAGLAGGETVEVTIALDTEERVVTPPGDLVRALRRVPGAWKRWTELSYTHRREHVEAIASAKAETTRARRIERAVAAVGRAASRRP